MEELRRRARELRNNATDAERHLWRHLRLQQMAGFRFRRQVPIAGFIADFLCPRTHLIIELDGGQHVEQANADEARTRALSALGYRVLRYWNDDVLLRTQDVLEDILRHANSTPPQPSPSLREREGDKGERE
ncbi:endonuclease domain-containing protein [Thermomonas brevis]|uniref:endonuclease domain-containing protein n=1 Tax=Thermomonas brevis TaxID=215691 RepID=UPI001FE2E4F1|nr:endonuclease domain-containing protein [Thermomonas brevis]